MIWLAVLYILLLGLIHIFARELLNLSHLQKKNWISFAGGVGTAFVFLDLLPMLKDYQVLFEMQTSNSLFEDHLYMWALAGLVIFYGLENAVLVFKKNDRKGYKHAFFWIHLGAFSLFNLLIGYTLINQQEQSFFSLTIFFFAVALHFLSNDFSLFNHHNHDYVKTGRWLVGSSVLLGGLLGALFEVPELMVFGFFSFLVGTIILNILKEELPGTKQGNFKAFFIGVMVFSILNFFRYII